MMIGGFRKRSDPVYELQTFREVVESEALSEFIVFRGPLFQFG
jgi:hypothetical protein